MVVHGGEISHICQKTILRANNSHCVNPDVVVVEVLLSCCISGVFPEGTQGPLIYSYGMCSWSELPKALYNRCINQELTLQEFMSLSMKRNENVPFSFIQSKTDDVQR